MLWSNWLCTRLWTSSFLHCRVHDGIQEFGRPVFAMLVNELPNHSYLTWEHDGIQEFGRPGIHRSRILLMAPFPTLPASPWYRMGWQAIMLRHIGRWPLRCVLGYPKGACGPIVFLQDLTPKRPFLRKQSSVQLGEYQVHLLAFLRWQESHALKYVAAPPYSPTKNLLWYCLFWSIWIWEERLLTSDNLVQSLELILSTVFCLHVKENYPSILSIFDEFFSTRNWYACFGALYWKRGRPECQSLVDILLTPQPAINFLCLLWT